MRLAARLIERLIIFGVLWWVLVEGDGSSWLFGLVFTLLASIASLSLTPKRSWRLRPLPALCFAGFFGYHSLLGGLDVTLRVLRPSMPLSPGLVTCPMRLPTESARVLLANTLSLMPGTLSAGFEGDTLVLHVVDCSLPVLDDVRLVEERIAGALGLLLDATRPPSTTTTGGANA